MNMHYLNLGIGIAVFAGIFWWMFSLCTKSGAQRKLELSTRRIASQPWDNDKVGRRGNR